MIKTSPRNAAIAGFSKYVICHDSGRVYTTKDNKKYKPLTVSAGYKVRMQRDSDGQRVSCDIREIYRETYQKWGPFGVSEETADADRKAAHVICNDEELPVPEEAVDQANQACVYGIAVRVRDTGQTGIVCGVADYRTWSVYVRLDVPVITRTTSTTSYQRSVFVYKTHQLEETG